MSSNKSSDRQKIHQEISTGDINSKGDVNVAQNASMQGGISTPTNSAEFVAQLNALIERLHALDRLDPDVSEARKEIEAATTEAQKSKPDGSVVRRFMARAKGILESISDIAGPLVPLATTIGELAKRAPEIFRSFGS